MPGGRRILHGANLIDGSGGLVIEDATVVIDGRQIVYAGPGTIRFDAPDAERWHLDGKTIIPGLIEAHTHAATDADMLAYLRNGITTIRFAGLNQADVALLNRRIATGEIPGPHILSCGPMIDQPPSAYPEWSVAVTTPAEAAIIADRLIIEHGLDALIVTQRVTAPVMKAVINAAHAHHRPVVGQVWAVDGEEAANLGIDELHTSSRVCGSRAYPAAHLLDYASIPERLALTSRAWASLDWDLTLPIMEAMIARRVSYCGMHVITQYLVGEGVEFLEADRDFSALFGDGEKQAFRDFAERLHGGWSEEDLDYGRRANDRRMEWMRRFRGLGGVLLAGTDMQFGGIMLHRELKNLEALGLSRLEVITTATGIGAKALGLQDRCGTIRPGLRADLIILNRDPRVDLAALREICGVLKEGDVVWDNGIAALARQKRAGRKAN
jgi:hypothetical protein